MRSLRAAVPRHTAASHCQPGLLHVGDPAPYRGHCVWHNFTTMMPAKSLTRLYFPEPIPEHGECRLPPAAAHHVARVLRLAAGDEIILFDGHGCESRAVIALLDKNKAVVRVTEQRLVDRESPLAVTLAQGVSSGDRMDYTIQKAVELGVAGVEPLISSRCVVKLSAERAASRVAHWQAVAVAACEQCGRNRVPAIAPVAGYGDWLARVAGRGADLRLLLSPYAEQRLCDLPRPGGPVTLLAGPEGGFDEPEAESAQRAGFVAVRLGPRVLRTETAALAALAAMQALWGDF